jgi:predicted nuclease of predicted toxin-antitoxin system
VRLLADENFPKPIVDSLRNAGHDVLWARTDCAGLNDPKLVELAEAEARVLLTLDKDFWQIALQRRTPLLHGYISTVTIEGIQMVPCGRR